MNLVEIKKDTQTALDNLQNLLEPLTNKLQELAELVEVKDEEIEELEKRPAMEVDNLREQMILNKFTELFNRKDYEQLETMLESYELL